MSRSEPPAWFQERKWKYPQPVDLSGWYGELLKCRKAYYGIDTSEWELEGEEMVPAFIGPPTVQSVEKADLSAPTNIERPSILLQIHLRPPDGTILEEFQKVLAEARSKYPSPVKQSGPPTLKARITKVHTTRWCNHRIIELAYIDRWLCAEPEKGRPSQADVAHWLFPKAAQPDKMLSDAYKTLRRALEMIPALWSQLKGAT
jgi:hypothetical protein